jgi:peptide/nickel transport system substrate-binding protein
VGTTFALTSLDLTKNAGGGYVVTNLALDPLVILGPQAQVEPWLATSVVQTSPTTYVYHLRHGVKFWDGSELTAADAAYSLNYYRHAGSQIAYEFPAVKSIVARGRYTVVVTLPKPNAAWKYTPAEILGIFEKKFALAHKGTFGNPGTLIMGTGPWIVDSLDPTTGAELSANPHWWHGSVPYQHVSFRFFQSETSLALAFRAHQIDLDPDISDAQAFASASHAKLLNHDEHDDCALERRTRAPRRRVRRQPCGRRQGFGRL